MAPGSRAQQLRPTISEGEETESLLWWYTHTCANTPFFHVCPSWAHKFHVPHESCECSPSQGHKGQPLTYHEIGLFVAWLCRKSEDFAGDRAVSHFQKVRPPTRLCRPMTSRSRSLLTNFAHACHPSSFAEHCIVCLGIAWFPNKCQEWPVPYMEQRPSCQND